MNEDRYEEASNVIKKAKISVGDKLILSNVIFRAERLEKEVERFSNENEKLEQQSNEMAEKHAEKDIVINQLLKEIESLKGQLKKSRESRYNLGQGM